MKTASPGRQRGVALLALLAVAMLAVLWIVLSRLNAASSGSTAARRMSNAEVLSQAKQALIGYVAKEVLDLSISSTTPRLPRSFMSTAGLATWTGRSTVWLSESSACLAA